MKTIKPKHNIAVLRKCLDLGQKDLAALVGSTRDQIQKIERRKMKLPEYLAHRISFVTGADYKWLRSNRVGKIVKGEDGKPVNRETFRRWKTMLSDGVDLNEVKNLLTRTVNDILLAAHEHGDLVSTGMELVLALRPLYQKADHKTKGRLTRRWARTKAPTPMGLTIGQMGLNVPVSAQTAPHSSVRSRGVLRKTGWKRP